MTENATESPIICSGSPTLLPPFPIATIHDIWSISVDIEALVQDFAETRIVKPSGQPERSPSSTALHCIRRAFWRFQLCYELVHAEECMPSRAEDQTQSQPSRRYLHYRNHQVAKPCFPSTGWLCKHAGKTPRTLRFCMHNTPARAVEEIGAVRFHLASLINAF